MKIWKTFITAIYIAAAPALFAQPGYMIDFDRIEQQKVAKFLDQEDITTADDLDSIHPLCVEVGDSGDYSYHTKSYIVKAPIDEVWDAYKSIRPEEAWGGKIGSFAFMYSRFSGQMTYRNDEEYDGMQVGQVIFLNLKFLGGLFNLAVGHEVTDINENEKYLQFCYLEGGKSQGSQRVELSRTTDGYTMVTHQTLYKSDSEFRDKNLYPVLHGLIISELHKCVRNKVEADTGS